MSILVLNNCKDSVSIEKNIKSLGYETISASDLNQLDKSKLETIKLAVFKNEESLEKTINTFKGIRTYHKTIPILLIYEKELDLKSLTVFREEGLYDFIRWPIKLVELKSRILAALAFFKQICQSQMLVKEAEYLRQLNNIGETVLNVSQNAVLISSIDGKIEWFNPSFKRLSGYELDELLGKSIRKLKYNNDDQGFYEHIFNSIQNEFAWQGDITAEGKNQKFIYEKLMVYPIFNFEGEIKHLVWIMPDLTEKKEYEQKFMEQMQMAKLIQRSVLSPALNEPGIQIDAIYKASEKLAGDMYAWYKIDEDRYGIIQLDIMGHGMSAALISMSIRSLLPGIIKKIAEPIKIMEELNRHMWNLFSSNNESIHTYFTAFYLVVDTKKQSIEYVNAGHPPSMLCENGEVAKLEEGCFAVGAFPKMKITKGAYQYSDEIKILLYTDGLIGAMDISPVKGLKKMEKSLRASYKKTNKEFLDLLRKLVYEEKDTLQDDVCIVSITLKPKKI